MCHSNAADQRSGGFTLIEALVALSIVAIVLSSIGALIATTVKGTRTVEASIGRLGAAKTILAALPDRQDLAPGTLFGDLGSHHWRMDVSPAVASSHPSVQWVPQIVVLTVLSPTAADIQIHTVRLVRKNSK